MKAITRRIGGGAEPSDQRRCARHVGRVPYRAGIRRRCVAIWIRSTRCSRAKHIASRSSWGPTQTKAELFTRFLQLLPTNEPMIEALLAEVDPAARKRITDAYPDYPERSACIRLGGDFAFGSAAWGMAEAHGRHAPTYLYRYDYAPRVLRWSGLGATHATELLAVFGYVPHQVRRAAHRTRRSTVGDAGHPRSAKVLAVIQPHGQPRRRLAGLHRHRSRSDGVRPQVPSRVRSAPRAAKRRGKAFPWRDDGGCGYVDEP